MKGYKLFNSDWTCRKFQYKVGETYEMEESPICCRRGFHFGETMMDCIENSPYFLKIKVDEKFKCAIVEALGEIDRKKNIICTNKIKIVKEIPIEEILENVNIGKDNVGFENVGSYNKGNYNAGDKNIGDFNIGSKNTGDENVGYGNIGNRNVGIENKGNDNIGSQNYGDRNTGSQNHGNSNAGARNVGHFNTGDRNIGDYNAGDFNIGSYNTGTFNKTNGSTGFFNTETEKVRMFNKPTDLTYEQAKSIIEKVEYIVLSLQSGGLKWSEVTQRNKDFILTLPNFDAEIFKEITGVDVNEDISSM